jgi:hypothetical protein
VKDGPDENAGGEQNDDVGNARESHEAVGHEGENKQAPEQREEEIQVHQ